MYTTWASTCLGFTLYTGVTVGYFVVVVLDAGIEIRGIQATNAPRVAVAVRTDAQNAMERARYDSKLALQQTSFILASERSGEKRFPALTNKDQNTCPMTC